MGQSSSNEFILESKALGEQHPPLPPSCIRQNQFPGPPHPSLVPPSPTLPGREPSQIEVAEFLQAVLPHLPAVQPLAGAVPFEPGPGAAAALFSSSHPRTTIFSKPDRASRGAAPTAETSRAAAAAIGEAARAVKEKEERRRMVGRTNRMVGCGNMR
jgi:hypothetical protein